MNTPLLHQNQPKPANNSQFESVSLLPHTSKNGLKRSLVQRYKFTALPDELIDLLPELAPAEVKVLIYIVYRTLGFNKQQDNISQRQFLTGIKTKDGRQLDRGAGVSRNSLIKSLKGLIEKGIITKEKRTAKNGKSLSCRYGLRFSEIEEPTNNDNVSNGIVPKVVTGGEYQKSHTNNKYPEDIKQRCNKKSDSRGKYAKDRDRVDYLIDEIEKVTGDTHSRGAFAQIAITLPDQIIFQILSEIKHTSGLRNKGAVFMSVAGKYMVKGVSVPPEKTTRTADIALIKADKQPLPEVVQQTEVKPTTPNSFSGRSLKETFCKAHPELAKKIGIRPEVAKDTHTPVHPQFMLSTRGERVQNTDLPDIFSRRSKAVNSGCKHDWKNHTSWLLSTSLIQSDGIGRGMSQPRNQVLSGYTDLNWLRLSLPPPLYHQRTVAP